MKYLVVGIIFWGFVQSQASTLKTPYLESFDLSKVETALKQSPQNLVAYIESQGVRVFKVNKSARLKLPANPIFNRTAVASPDDLERCDIEVDDDSSEDGRFLQKDLTFCESKYDWIYIADTSSSLTLIHEFMHFLFYKAENTEDAKISGNVAENLRREHRFMMKNFGALSSNENLMKVNHYREGLVSGCLDFSKAFVDGVRLQLSEEIIIERTLEKIAVGSVFYSAKRIAKGKIYVQNNLNTVAEMAIEFEGIVDWIATLLPVLNLDVPLANTFGNDIQSLQETSKRHYEMHRVLSNYVPEIRSL